VFINGDAHGVMGEVEIELVVTNSLVEIKIVSEDQIDTLCYLEVSKKETIQNDDSDFIAYRGALRSTYRIFFMSWRRNLDLTKM
jgi:hypothetical protein